MSEKGIVQKARDIQLAMELITLDTRLQMLESEIQLSRRRLIRLYKELRGNPPPKSMPPFSTDWFMTWERNVHASIFCNARQFLLKTDLCSGVDTVIKAYRLYLEQYPQAEEGPLLALARAWMLVRFVESGLLQLSSCNCYGDNFITRAYQPIGGLAYGLRQPPSRAVERHKLSQNPTDIIPQLLGGQRIQAVQLIRCGKTSQQR